VYVDEQPFVDEFGVPNVGNLLPRTHLIGFVDQACWVRFAEYIGGGRARFTALEQAAGRWGSGTMTRVLKATFAVRPDLESPKPQLQQLVDSVRSPYSIQGNSNNLGVFIGGTSMHFYGVGNVERMYNQYVGTRFYFGGIANDVDSQHEFREGGFAWTEFEGNMDYMLEDIRRYGRGKEIHIFGWSRGGAQAAELARRLGGEGITVSFVGMFDPVYSVDRPGQSSSLIRRSLPGKSGNFVTRDLAANIRTAVAIYAMNEVRSWFPATYFEPDNGSATNIISIGSPGAHGEVGGHWLSNPYVQQLNYHVMMKYAEDYSSANFAYWDSDNPAQLDPQVKAIYESNYTTFLAIRGSVKAWTSKESLKRTADKYAEAWQKLTRWKGYSAEQYVRRANSRVEDHWKPSRLSSQENEYFPVNAVFVVEYLSKRHELEDALILGRHFDEVIHQDHRDHYRRHLGWITRHLWDTYDGIDKDFMKQLYERVIDADQGDWKS
jgi:hypothetical protein